MRKLLTDLTRELEAGRAAMLCTVTDSRGSVPRGTGARVFFRHPVLGQQRPWQMNWVAFYFWDGEPSQKPSRDQRFTISALLKIMVISSKCPI